MYNTGSLLSEAQEAYDKVWFVQSLEVNERTDYTLSLRLYIRHGLFVHAFIGKMTDSLYSHLLRGVNVFLESTVKVVIGIYIPLKHRINTSF